MSNCFFFLTLEDLFHCKTCLWVVSYDKVHSLVVRLLCLKKKKKTSVKQLLGQPFLSILPLTEFTPWWLFSVRPRTESSRIISQIILLNRVCFGIATINNLYFFCRKGNTQQLYHIQYCSVLVSITKRQLSLSSVLCYCDATACNSHRYPTGFLKNYMSYTPDSRGRNRGFFMKDRRPGL